MTDSINHEWAERFAHNLTEQHAGHHQLARLAHAYLDLRARNERLREALAPFARVADTMDMFDAGYLVHDGGKLESECVRVEHFRRARQAYEEGGR